MRKLIKTLFDLLEVCSSTCCTVLYCNHRPTTTPVRFKEPILNAMNSTFEGSSDPSEVMGEAQASDLVEVSVPPSTDEDWHLKFIIPELWTFSLAVQDAVKTGVIQGRARKEIIRVLRTYILSHTQ